MARLLHGILLGVFLTLVSAFLELQVQFASWPYHADRALFAHWLPLHLVVGAALGIATLALLPLLDRQQLRRRQAGLAMASVLVGLLFMLGAGSARLFGGALGWLGNFALGGLLGLALTWLCMRASRSRYGWIASGFVTPWFGWIGTVAMLGVAWIGVWQGARPAPSAPLVERRAQAGEQPNVLLIVLDTVSASHLGCYGYHRPTSPTLDALAGEGALFRNAFAAAPWTLPSHASLFTGLHPTTHRTGWTHPRLHDGKAGTAAVRYDFLTLAEALGRRGYDSCGVSEKAWLTDRHGLTQGFSHYYDYSIARPSERLLLPSIVDRVLRKLGAPALIPERLRDKGGARVVETALDWLGRRERERPYFLMLNLNEAHSPYVRPEGFPDFARWLPEGVAAEDLPAGYFAHAHDRKAYNSGARELLEDEAEIQKALYDANILYQDQLLAKLFEGLRELQLMEDTLIVVTADHGEEFNEQGRFGHQLSLSDRLLHVPLIFRMPSRVPAGQRLEANVSLVDVFPTVLAATTGLSGGTEAEAPPMPELSDAPQLEAIEGYNLLPWMRGESECPRDWILAHADNPTAYLARFPNFALDETFPLADTSMHSITMLRSGNQKYFRFGDGTESWLSLELDPRENAGEYLAAEFPPLEHPEQAERMRTRLDQLLGMIETRRELLCGHLARVPVRAAANPGDTQQMLELLGYLGSSGGTGPVRVPRLPGRLFED